VNGFNRWNIGHAASLHRGLLHVFALYHPMLWYSSIIKRRAPREGIELA
jgi:hypothetical protein